MRDQFLFAVVPYVAALVLVPIGITRYALSRQRPTGSPTPTQGKNDRVVRRAWQSALAITALGHMLALAFPDALLSWNREMLRLVVLEISGVIAGSLATAGVLIALVRLIRGREGDERPATVEIMARTLALVAMSSGVAIAIVYRWASSWSGVTLVPYLHSLVRLEPATALVTHLPLLVKLHVVCAFALLAVLPFTGMARVLVAPIQRLARVSLTPLVSLGRTAATALVTLVPSQAHAWRARILRNSAEEN